MASMRHHVLDPVLAVRVEGDEAFGARLAQRVAQAGLEGGALAEVDRVPDQVRAGSGDLVRRAVGAAVVDADDVREGTQCLFHDARDHGGLVVHRDDEPHVAEGALSAELCRGGNHH